MSCFFVWIQRDQIAAYDRRVRMRSPSLANAWKLLLGKMRESKAHPRSKCRNPWLQACFSGHSLHRCTAAAGPASPFPLEIPVVSSPLQDATRERKVSLQVRNWLFWCRAQGRAAGPKSFRAEATIGDGRRAKLKSRNILEANKRPQARKSCTKLTSASTVGEGVLMPLHGQGSFTGSHV